MSNFFIIGGSSGIGRQLSVQLLNTGHRVYATFNEHEMRDEGERLTYHQCNVLDDPVQIDYLPDTLDGLVYCPGRINLKPFHRIQPGEYIKDYELQVVGALKMINLALPRLKSAGKASIVWFSTVAVQVGFPFHAQVAASKGAIEGLTKSLAAEFAPQVRVNCIAPSLTDTPLAKQLLSNDEKREANAQRHPLKKIGKAEDLANMAEFLLTDKSDWITGQVFHVDGGMATLKI